MKTIIAGGRDLRDLALVDMALSRCGFADAITEVVSGGAVGIDRAGETYATQRRLPIKQFPADWQRHGRAAGPDPERTDGPLR